MCGRHPSRPRSRRDPAAGYRCSRESGAVGHIYLRPWSLGPAPGATPYGRPPSSPAGAGFRVLVPLSVRADDKDRARGYRHQLRRDAAHDEAGASGESAGPDDDQVLRVVGEVGEQGLDDLAPQDHAEHAGDAARQRLLFGVLDLGAERLPLVPDRNEALEVDIRLARGRWKDRGDRQGRPEALGDLDRRPAGTVAGGRAVQGDEDPGERRRPSFEVTPQRAPLSKREPPGVGRGRGPGTGRVDVPAGVPDR